jgi:hypothetical protein
MEDLYPNTRKFVTEHLLPRSLSKMPAVVDKFTKSLVKLVKTIGEDEDYVNLNEIIYCKSPFPRYFLNNEVLSSVENYNRGQFARPVSVMLQYKHLDVILKDALESDGIKFNYRLRKDIWY